MSFTVSSIYRCLFTTARSAYYTGIKSISAFRNGFIFHNDTRLSTRFLSCTETHNRDAVRVRFAPSPTGFLHLGGLRTAMYNYFYAKSHGGVFILRIEDTDQTRIVPGSQEDLENMLDWMGLTPDESPSKGGQYGPYLQSKRTNLYKEKAHELVESGAAYKCFCSEVRLSLLRKEAARNHETPRYDGRCRYLSKAEVDEYLSNNSPYVIRFKISNKPVTFHDMIHGPITLNISESEGDPVILKSDGYPTYHLACVIDDHFMKITHVLRGVEWQTSTPKHLMLYDAFQWNPPVFAHLPLIVNTDGTKLSKRQGGIQVSHLKEKGYFPIALLNFMCSFGGGFGKQGEPEILSKGEIVSKFSLSQVNTNPARMAPEKLETYNRLALSYLLKDDQTSQVLVNELKTLICKEFGFECDKKNSKITDNAYIKRILHWSTTRICRLSDLTQANMKFLWIAPSNVSSSIDVKGFNADALQTLVQDLKAMPSDAFTIETLAPYMKSFSLEKGLKFSTLMQVLRVILTGSKQGPAIGEIMVLIGQDETIRRLNSAMNYNDEERCASSFGK